MSVEVITALRDFLAESQYLREGQSVADDEPLLDSGVIDSLSIMDIRTFIEKRYLFSVADADLVPENFESLAAMSAYIAKKLESN